MRRKLFASTEAITRGLRVANAVRTAASTSVRVENCSPNVTANRIRQHFGRYGKILHVGVSLNNRELILAIQARQTLVQTVHDSCVSLLRFARQANALADRTYGRQGAPSYKLRDGRWGGGGNAGASERLSALDEVERASETAFRERDRATQVRLLAKSRVLKENVARLEAHDRKTRVLTRQRHECTGTVFVSFADFKGAQRCLKYSRYTKLDSRQMQVSPAPPSDQVHWENLQVGKASRWCRQLLSILILVLVSSISSVVITLSTYFKVDVDQLLFGNCMQGSMPEANQTVDSWLPLYPPAPFAPPSPPPPFLPTVLASAVEDEYQCLATEKAKVACELSFFQQLPAMLGSTVCIIGGYVAIFIVTPLLAQLLERAQYTYERELSVFLKLAAFQVINVLISMCFALYDPRREDRNSLRGWLSYASPVVINVLIGDVFIVHLLIDMGRPDCLINRHIKSRWAATQGTLNRLWQVDPDLWIVFRLQLAAKVIVLSLMFSSAIPLLHLLTTAYCMLASIVDKYLLFRVVRKPPKADSLRLMYGMVCWLFPLAVLFRLAFAIFVYFGLDCACEKTAFSSDDGIGSPGGATGGGASAVLPPSPPSFPADAFNFATWSQQAFQGALASRKFGQLVVLYGSGFMFLLMLGFLCREAVYIWCIARLRNHARINRAPVWKQLLPSSAELMRKLGPIGKCLGKCFCREAMAKEKAQRVKLKAGTFNFGRGTSIALQSQGKRQEGPSGRTVVAGRLLPTDATASDERHVQEHQHGLGLQRLKETGEKLSNGIKESFKTFSDYTQLGIDLLMNSAQETAMDEQPPLLGQFRNLESHSASFYGRGARAQISPSVSSHRSEDLSDARISLMSYKSSGRSEKWDEEEEANHRPSTVQEEDEEADFESVEHGASHVSIKQNVGCAGAPTAAATSGVTSILSSAGSMRSARSARSVRSVRMAPFSPASMVSDLAASVVSQGQAMEVPDDPSRELMYMPPLTRHLLELLAVSNVIEAGHTLVKMRSRNRQLALQKEMMNVAAAARESRLFDESSGSSGGPRRGLQRMRSIAIGVGLRRHMWLTRAGTPNSPLRPRAGTPNSPLRSAPRPKSKGSARDSRPLSTVSDSARDSLHSPPDAV